MLKPGVDVRGFQSETLLAIQEARAVYERFGFAFVITSGADPTDNRLEESKHPLGLAFDVRIRHLPGFTQETPGLMATFISGDIRKALGSQYDVVLKMNHIHIEFDPD